MAAINQDSADMQKSLTDPWATYASKLQYKADTNLLDIQRQACLQEQKMCFAEWQERMRIYYSEYRKLLGSNIYIDVDGNLIYSIRDMDEKTIVSRRLLNVGGFSSVLLTCVHPKQQAILRLSWDIPKTGNLDILFGPDGIATGVFLKQLRAKGVRLLVSGRTEHRAADDLVAYAICTASMQEIPYSWGWNKFSDDSWHFCRKGELCILEVMRRV